MTEQPVIVDVFLSVDGWAGSDNLPGHFGYFGPQLDEWINAELDIPQLYLVGRRTYKMLAGLPDEALDEKPPNGCSLQTKSCFRGRWTR